MRIGSSPHGIRSRSTSSGRHPRGSGQSRVQFEAYRTGETRLIREAKARWARSGPPCYEITENFGNFWAPAGAWTLTVCHGRFVRARDDQGAPPLPSMLSTGFSDDDSVDGLFTELERYAIKDPLDFYYDVEFDPEMGFPRKIDNGWRNAYDAEWIVRVVKLSSGPNTSPMSKPTISPSRNPVPSARETNLCSRTLPAVARRISRCSSPAQVPGGGSQEGQELG
jgi:uncharacterized protein DUF6174